MAQITLNSSGVASNGTLALQSNGTTTAVTIDASQKVGIGTASPSEKLHLEGSGSQYMRVKTTTTNADMYFGITSSSVGYVGTGGSDPLAFYTAGTVRARIDSSGSLLVGTSSLTTGVSGTETTLIVKGNSAGKSASLVLQNNTGTGIGYLGVGETTGITYLSAKSNHPLVFQTNDTERARIDSSGNFLVTSAGGLGYGTGSGGAVTQATSRTTGVTLNKTNGAITLVSAAGLSTFQSFTVTNSTVAATDVVSVVQKSGTDLYQIFVTAVAAVSFRITFATTGGITTEQPVFNFAVLKAVTA